MGETYRVFVYVEGNDGKTVLDSGSLGTTTQFTIPAGGLPDGKYDALVQVRDAVVGYGESTTQFHFSLLVPSSRLLCLLPRRGSRKARPASPPNLQHRHLPRNRCRFQRRTQRVLPQPITLLLNLRRPSADKPDLKLNLSADKTNVGPGDSIIYTLEVENAGKGAAPGVVVTDKLPDGVQVDTNSLKSTTGKVTSDEPWHNNRQRRRPCAGR